MKTRRRKRRNERSMSWRRDRNAGAARGLVAGWAACVLVAGWAAALAADPAPQAEVPALSSATISPDEVSRGQKGYGLSVFAGTEPERFEVEIIGVMRDQAPDTSFVLARLSGMNLEQSGVIAGMSGSPVYIDERLVGAVAFAWPFSHEAIAGITPIGAMRRLNDGESSSAAPASASSRPQSRRELLPDVALSRGRRAVLDGLRLPGEEEALGLQLEGEDLFERLESRLAALGRLRQGEGRSALQWAASGFSPRAHQLLDRSLERLTPAGSMTTAGPQSTAAAVQGVEGLAPGGAVAAVLVDGDMRLAATGTVTDRLGDEVLGFGHPFLGLGPVEIPMATAEVVTVLSSQFSSFKISNVGQVVGAFDLDRAPGIHGKIGSIARTLPLVLEVRGETTRRYDMQLAQIPQITPALVGTAVISGVDATTQVRGERGVDARLTFEFEGHRPLVLDQVFDGPAPASSVAFLAMTLAGYFLDSDLLMPELSSIHVAMTEHPEPRLVRLVGAHASRRVAHGGDDVLLHLEWVGHRSVASRSTLEIELPSHLPAGRYSLIVGDGVTVDTVLQSIAQVAPSDFAEAFDYLEGLGSADELRVLGLLPGQGFVFDGSLLPQLPGSVRSIWEGSGSASSLVPVRLAVVQDQTFELEGPIAGGVRVDIEIVEGQTAKADEGSS